MDIQAIRQDVLQAIDHMEKQDVRDEELEGFMGSIAADLENVRDLSDGYHTFNQLYQHRNAMFLLMANQTGEASFKTKRNGDGEEFPGYFLVGINTPIGQISYHMPIEYWDYARVKEVERNEWYDGHTSDDVYQRIMMAVAGSV
jgi:hypothetical protein